nr:hypothetical protein [Tanacetum cinerariifolium]
MRCDFGGCYTVQDEEVSSNDNEVTEVKALMALVDEARVFVGKKRINQLTEDTSNSGLKDLVFVKSSADNSEVSITGSNKPKLSKAKDSTLSKHDTSKSVAPLPPLEKLTGAEHVFRPKTIKSILKSKSTFKAKTLKGITINEPSSALVSGNKSSSAFKTNSALADKALENSKVFFSTPTGGIYGEVEPSFKDLDSPEDDYIIVVDENDEDEEAAKVHATQMLKVKILQFLKSSSPRSS